MPQAKSGTVATVIDNNIILIGGKSIVEGSPVSDIFDIKGNIWRPISIMPKKLIGTRIVNIGGKGLVCGGFNNQKIEKTIIPKDRNLQNHRMVFRLEKINTSY